MVMDRFEGLMPTYVEAIAHGLKPLLSRWAALNTKT